jgi:hypothetical protein
MCPFLAERPPIAVGIKGPMNFWVWYEVAAAWRDAAFRKQVVAEAIGIWFFGN